MAERTDSPPSGLTEKVAVVASRRRLLFGVAVAIGVLAAVVTLMAPGVLPSNAVFGAAVGIAALLVGLAATLAADAADLVVRGRRHVHAAGADVAAVIGRDPDDVTGLLAVVAGTSRAGRVRVGVVAATRNAGAPAARATALGRSLAHAGKRVLLTDMTRGTSSAPGLSEVVAGTHRLRDVVKFEQGVYLGHVAIGTDPVLAMDGYAEWVERLPSDLEVLIAAFPPISDPGALAAVRSLDVVLLQVEMDRTERVDLLASLDALDAAGVSTEVILIDPSLGLDAAGAEMAEDEAEDEASDEAGSADETEVVVEAEVDGADAPTDVPPVPPVEVVAEDEDDLQPPAFVTDPDHTGTDDGDDADDTVDDPAMGGQPTSAADLDLPAADDTVEIGGDSVVPVVTPPDVYGAVPGLAPERDDEPIEANVPVDREGGRWLDPRTVWSDLPTAPEPMEPDPVASEPVEPDPETVPPDPEPEPVVTADTAAPAVPAPRAEDVPIVHDVPAGIERDALTDEAVRATAALQALAFRVWEREEQS